MTRNDLFRELIPEGERVLCALSGGVDSVYLLCQLKERGIDLCAAHYNHCLRGEESERDERFVRELCANYEVELRVGRGDVSGFARENSLGIEEAARKLRYAFLESAADELSAGLIATAHNADDNAETMLINLARGTGLRGLGGIPPRRGNIIRPILYTTRAEIERYMSGNSIPYVEDSTNAGDEYTRNRIRHSVVPVLRGINPDFDMSAARASRLLREDELYLESLAQDFINTHVTRRGVPVSELVELPKPLSARVVRIMSGALLAQTHVDAVLELAEGSGLGSCDLPGTCAVREQGFIRFGHEAAATIVARPILLDGDTQIPESGIIIRCSESIKPPEINSSFNTFFFKCENICGTICCTARMPGDKIRLLGRGCTKRLSDIFSEGRLTQRERDLTCVLRDDAGPIAVYGLGMAERCAAQPGERSLKVEMMKIKNESRENGI